MRATRCASTLILALAPLGAGCQRGPSDAGGLEAQAREIPHAATGAVGADFPPPPTGAAPPPPGVPELPPELLAPDLQDPFAPPPPADDGTQL